MQPVIDLLQTFDDINLNAAKFFSLESFPGSYSVFSLFFMRTSHITSEQQQNLHFPFKLSSSEFSRGFKAFAPVFFLCFLVFGHRLVGKQDLRVRWASVAKLVLRSSIFQITHQTSQLAAGDVVVTIFLTHHLKSNKDLTCGQTAHVNT